MTTLSDTIDRVEVVLDDTGNARYSTDQITEALRQVLQEYASAYPNYATRSLIFSAAGREIDAKDAGGDPLPIIDIVKIYFPYDSTADEPKRHEVFYFFNMDGQPTLHIQGDYIPQKFDVALLYYTKPHTIAGLDSETVDSFPATHLNLLVIGASAVAALNRAAALSEKLGSRSSDTNQLEVWGKHQRQLFETMLDAVRAFSGRHPVHHSESRWELDQWDQTRRGVF